jgi:2,3-bisphosphoglycerate-independent phosphoglycerate mutase
MLCILDGFGWVPEQPFGNAIVAAKKPHLDQLFATCPYTTIGASGMSVGLPDGQMGNSEVGHTNIGAGRVVYQQLTLITKSIQDGEMQKNPVLVKNMKAAIDAGKAIHFMGLMGTGGVHSHQDHLFGLLDMAKALGAKEVYVHAIMDGRDTDPHSGEGFLQNVQDKLNALGIGKIATVTGRYYAMDRDNNWDREEKAYAAFVYGEGNHAAGWKEAIEASYKADVSDEFVLPCVTCEGGRVQAGDTVVFLNFRPDRARQMTRIFCDDDFKGFVRRNGRFPVQYVCMAQYDATMPNCEVAYPPVDLTNVMGEYLAKLGKTQLRIAETEKYAHVTFFFNGGREEPFAGEDRCVIPSPKVATYDLQPEMSAYKVADECVKRIESGKYDVIILNFANCDMVGHTGVFDAAVKAVEAVDECAGKVIDAVLKAGGAVVLTADHGNADKMENTDGSPFTAHTTNPVPCLVAGVGDVKLRKGGVLSDLVPTMLEIMDVPQPKEMTGKSLIEH